MCAHLPVTFESGRPYKAKMHLRRITQSSCWVFHNKVNQKTNNMITIALPFTNLRFCLATAQTRSLILCAGGQQRIRVGLGSWESHSYDGLLTLHKQVTKFAVLRFLSGHVLGSKPKGSTTLFHKHCFLNFHSNPSPLLDTICNAQFETKKNNLLIWKLHLESWNSGDGKENCSDCALVSCQKLINVKRKCMYI